MSVVKATASAWEEFKESVVWHDTQQELENWKSDVIAMYPKAETLLEKGRIDGRLEALSYFLTLPDVFIEAIREANKEPDRNKRICEKFTDEDLMGE